MPEVTLRDCVHDLTRRHIRRDGPTRGQWEDALLDQLDAAISTIGKDGGVSSEPSTPINLNAMKLQQQVAQTVRDEQWERGGETQMPVVDILREWEEETDEDQHLTHVVLDLVDQIRRQLEPPPVKRRPLWMPCYDCGRMWVPGDDGERKPAVTVRTHDDMGKMLSPAEMEMGCAHCGTTRTGEHEMAWPLKVMKDTPKRRQVNYTGVV